MFQSNPAMEKTLAPAIGICATTLTDVVLLEQHALQMVRVAAVAHKSG